MQKPVAAPILVATLETQKHRLIKGDGPALLVVDEYQMLADPETAQCGVIASGLLIEAADPALTILITAKTAKNPMNLLD